MNNRLRQILTFIVTFGFLFSGCMGQEESKFYGDEISPSVPPGTTVNCRLRVTFTNCENCHNITSEDTGNTYSANVHTPFEQDGDEYKDYKYSGADPFQIINYQFTVID